jgi:glyoxylase-like metal-dependent hydrolase (beta-lactamase superfamily II)
MHGSSGVRRVTRGVANFYLVESPGGLVAVDSGVAGDWPLLVRTLATTGRGPSDLKAILLTHAHADHTGFSERARSEAHVAVWTHRDDVAVAQGAPPAKQEAGAGPYLRHLEAWRTLFGLLLHGGMRIVPILEVSAFEDGQTLEVPGRPTVIHLPGHTAGMSALHFASHQTVFTGDALVTRNPLTGRRGPQVMPAALNVDSGQALASLSKLESLPAKDVLPGHGEPWTEGVGEAVRRARSAGRS